MQHHRHVTHRRGDRYGFHGPTAGKGQRAERFGEQHIRRNVRYRHALGAILKQRRHQRIEQVVRREHPAGPAQHRTRQAQCLQCINLGNCALEAKAVCCKGGPGQMRPQSIQQIDDLLRHRAVILMPRHHNRD